MEEFNEEWNTKFNEFEQRSKNYEETLKQKHAKEMDDLYVYLEQKLSKHVKYSKEFLSLKNQEENLVKLQRYAIYNKDSKKPHRLERKSISKKS